MINGNKKCGSSSPAAGERKKNRLPNKRESEKARNRSASAKWAGNKGKSSAHLRVKWTVDNINRGRCRWCAREGKFRAILFALRVSRTVSLVLLPRAALPPLSFVSLLPPLLRTTPHRERILREEFSATRSRRYPEGNLLTRSKFSSRKSFEKSHPRVQR